MQYQSHTWESALLSLAHEARRAHDQQVKTSFDTELLAQAYAYCDSVTALHSRSFYMASSLLPAPTRRAVRALYAFCRVSDDIVDAPPLAADHSRKVLLDRWRAIVMNATPPRDDLVAVAWTDTRMAYAIPPRYAEQLIDGVAQDLTPRRYETFEELAAYAYGVASTVGLMSMHIIGYASNEAVRYAIKLGVALQVTNILRDVGEDLSNGRIYLPQEELDAFGLCDEQLQRRVVSRAWREFMKFQIERNRRLYAEAMPGISLLNKQGRLAITAAAELYKAILGDIERYDYDVFNRRASVSRLGKVSRLPKIWWQSKWVRISR
jgi:15-cis-phytoene synthase